MSKKCYHTHPPYEIVPGAVVYGGNCRTPAVQADCYVGLDPSMKDIPGLLPWHGSAVYFYIPNMGVPKSIDEFKNLLNWIMARLKDGKTVHIGCIGGHGRTGLVLAALTQLITNDPDATQRVRDEYCEKAVESKEQVEWLQKHFGINPVKPRYGPPKKNYTPRTKQTFMKPLEEVDVVPPEDFQPDPGFWDGIIDPFAPEDSIE